jgi:hypothetical protein
VAKATATEGPCRECILAKSNERKRNDTSVAKAAADATLSLSHPLTLSPSHPLTLPLSLSLTPSQHGTWVARAAATQVAAQRAQRRAAVAERTGTYLYKFHHSPGSSQGQNLALTVLYVPCSLDGGPVWRRRRQRSGPRGARPSYITKYTTSQNPGHVTQDPKRPKEE